MKNSVSVNAMTTSRFRYQCKVVPNCRTQNSSRATSRVLWREPPRADSSGDNDVHRILDDLVGEEEGKQEEEQVSVVYARANLDAVCVRGAGIGAGVGSKARQDPENGPSESQGFKHKGREDDTTIPANGSASCHQIGRGEGNATPHSASVTDPNQEKNGAKDTHDPISRNEGEDSPGTTQQNDKYKRRLDQERGDPHHDHEHAS